MINQALILAAGLGTRMGDLSQHTPKPLLPYQGKPMLDYMLDAFALSGAARIVVNIHAHADKMRTHLEGRRVLISDESAALQGTGGALHFARARGLLLDEPCFTHNCDVFFSPSPEVWAGILTKLALAWDNKMLALLLLHKNEGESGGGGGDFSLDPKDKIIAGGDYFYTGVQILSPSLFQKPVLDMEDIWNEARTAGLLYGVALPSDWRHLGTREEYEKP